jgi:hypothetical protein
LVISNSTKFKKRKKDFKIYFFFEKINKKKRIKLKSHDRNKPPK